MWNDCVRSTNAEVRFPPMHALQILSVSLALGLSINASLMLVTGFRLNANCPTGAVCCVANIYKCSLSEAHKNE